jgi:enamine deaminase RidA (YjgF/YER057c/UK114 family)
MDADSNEHVVSRQGSRSATAERRPEELGILLPARPKPFGAYVEAVQAGNLLSLSGMLPTEGHAATFVGRVGAEVDHEAERQAARLAALNVLVVARQHLGSLDKLARVMRPGVAVASSGDVREQPKIAGRRFGAAAGCLRQRQNSCRLVFGVASQPLVATVELEVIIEVAG